MKRRSGFTLVELLVVIGVIMVLGGILFVGVRRIRESMATKQTRATLESARSLLTEYEGIAGLNKITAVYASNSPADTVAAPTGVMEDGPDRFNSLAVKQTMGGSGVPVPVMQYIWSVPRNRAIREKMPPASFMKDSTGAALANAPLLDAWNNPIIYVPKGGLTGVTVGSLVNRTITSSGIYASGAVTPPSDRPFWASAGADGDFSKGDDNIYSFEN